MDKKTVFVSQPIGNKSIEQINAEFDKIRLRLEAQGYDVKESYLCVKPGAKNVPLYCLAEVMKIISNVDCVYFADGWKNNRACRIEHEACIHYDVKILRD